MSLTQKCRRNLALLLVAAGGVGTAAAIARSSDEVAPPGEVVSVEADGFRYEYHVPSGRETLFELRDGKPQFRNVLRDHEETVAACRRSLECKFGVKSLKALRARYDDTIRRLQSLGYL